MKSTLYMVCALVLGCAPAEDEMPSQQAGAPADTAALVASIGNLETPESMIHDSVQDVYFVSSINGGGGARDGNGFISRVHPDGTVQALHFIAGGRNGVQLDAPKGMAVHEGLLWVADLDHVRWFDAVSGEPRGSMRIDGAVFLNDVVVAPDGVLYVSDTRLDFSAGDTPSDDRQYRIYRIEDGRASIALADSLLARPNGLAWGADGRLMIAPLSATHLLAWQPGTDTLVTFGTGPGGYDGIIELEPNEFLVSTIDANQVGRLDAVAFRVALDSLTFPADIGLDRRRGRVLVPRLMEGRAEVWSLPSKR